ncbi:response regulator [Alphaproteobacteria bacterium]|jgi:two-component system, LuxR family, response regulator DctR|nr:response regulator [Alphaproteobacteria bacterium]
MNKKLQKHIYLLEDDEDLSEALSMTLEHEKYICHAFHSTLDFFEAIDTSLDNSTESIETLILDINLGKESGIEVFNALKNKIKYLAIPIIFLTGHGDIYLAKSTIQNGAFDFLSKPISEQDLMETVELSMKEALKRKEIKKFLEEWKEKEQKLTEKESEVMLNICKGNSNKEISEIMGNSIRTIELHRSRIFDKFKVSSAVELASNSEKFIILVEKYNVIKF